MLHTINISNVFLLFLILVYFNCNIWFRFELSDLTEGLYIYIIIFSPLKYISVLFYYIAVMDFFTINDTVVFFSVKHNELIDVRNALYK